MRRRVVCLTLAAVCGGSVPLAAQSGQRISLQASGLHIRLSGEAFDSLANGTGAEAQIRYTGGKLSYGGGIQFTRHDRGGASNTATSNTANLIGLFFEPRYTIDIGTGRAAPYLSARIAYSQFRFKIDQENYQASGNASGPTINAGGGVLVNISARVNLDLGATFGYAKYSDLEYSYTRAGSGETFLLPLGSGKNLVLRVGFALGLGG